MQILSFDGHQALEGVFRCSRHDAAGQHTAVAPWHIVRADDKRVARLNLMRDILSRLHYAGKKAKLVQLDPDVAFKFTPDCSTARRLAR